MLSGLALVGITRSADANIGNGYTLLSIAGVILGGGEFVGGIVSPIGAVIGALTLTLASTQLLGFLRIPPDWQVGANGAILVIVLAARVLIAREGGPMTRCSRALSPTLDLVVPRRAGRLARRGAIHRRLWRRRHADGGAVAGRFHGDRRRRADVRHHARPRQCRPVAARQYRPRQRGGDEDDGRRRFASSRSACRRAR